MSLHVDSEINIETLAVRVGERLSKPCKDLQGYAWGSHHKVFIATLADEAKVLVRIHCPAFRRPGSGSGITPAAKMASEIATMQLVQENTGIPVPDVFAYDPDEDGKVGGEWMVMEFVEGVELQKAWPNMNKDQRSLVVRSIADVWAQLLKLRFSSIGSIWDDGKGGFRVGPMTFMPSNNFFAVAPPDPEKCGPFDSPRRWLLAMAEGDLKYQLSLKANSLQLQYKNTAMQRIAFDGVVPEERDDDMSTIALEHGDMNCSNILLDAANPVIIKSVIDWEGTRTAPLWAIQPRPFDHIDEEAMSSQEKQLYQRLFRAHVGQQVPAWLAATGEPGKQLRQYLVLAQLSNVADPLEDFERTDKWMQGVDFDV
ncbi:hypothetical protein NEOLEDRAFT_1179935 [Neolentinus lepideus HHB14362 ss-1]|uniref:Aminoglycoside phosphotransferase domain-containing protein n=1 Tax=Neolentinus lepideus HHB14362 ss-1 TaxID=1314782 RepID=A0A165RF32_9AGAM|nr:hypothetical protein NEOLEDRAFT_1179935 [Neolentinus lepideus HHB14362 ss-1]